MRFETKMKVMMIIILFSLFFLSMWIISDTRLFIGLIVFVAYVKYDDNVRRKWHDYDIVTKKNHNER